MGMLSLYYKKGNLWAGRETRVHLRGEVPHYIVAMVFHDQANSIDAAVTHLDDQLRNLNVDDHAIHTGPIIRKEENYKYMSIDERRRILNKMTAFIKEINIEYKCFYIEK